MVETAAKRGKMVCGYHANQAKLAPKAYLTGAEWNWVTAYKTSSTRRRPASRIRTSCAAGSRKAS